MVVALLILSLSSIIVTANAYNLLGGRWSDSDVRDLTWKMPSGSWWYWQLHYCARQAANTWDFWCYPVNFREVSGSQLVTYYSYWEESNVLAYARLYPSVRADPYTSGRIYFNEAHLDVGYYRDWHHVQAVFAHEQGHIVGLAHENSYGPTVLMYYTDAMYLIGGVFRPTWDDQCGVGALYG